MPALFLADSPTSKEVRDSTFKQPKNKDSMSPELNGSAEENKLSNPENGDVDADADATADAVKPAPSKKVSENGVPKKARIIEDEKDDDGGDAGPTDLNNFRISNILKERLNSKGIKALFPIQAMTFDMILDGADLVGRARTGQGKTLAFVLPILESLTNGMNKASMRTGYGRSPCVLVLLPTRELAKQVHLDFEFYGRAVGLSSCCIYGGSSYDSQQLALRRGVDIVVGTPGRIKDQLDRGALDLKSLKFRVLDESDEMLNLGFLKDVELILGKVANVNKVQTLLFSATLPDWVDKISNMFLKSERKTVDLVGNEKLKASATVRHLALPCSSAARPHIIPDLIRCYSSGGRTIIFTETKESTSQLSDLLSGSRALHGDVVQGQRGVILSGFRSGKFLVLVATNAAARGLDINDVQLIIQCEPPKEVEAYIHRFCRTGRAGNSGISILLYEPKYSLIVSRIEKQSGVKFEHVSAPKPSDIADLAGYEAADDSQCFR